MTGPLARCGRAVGRHHALKHVLLGIEPSIIVIAAAMKNVHSLTPPLGKNWNLPSRAAYSTTLPAACQVGSKPGNRQQAHANHDHLLKSVTATDHMPPYKV